MEDGLTGVYVEDGLTGVYVDPVSVTMGIEWNAGLPPLVSVTMCKLVSDSAKSLDVLGWFSPSINKIIRLRFYCKDCGRSRLIGMNMCHSWYLMIGMNMCHSWYLMIGMNMCHSWYLMIGMNMCHSWYLMIGMNMCPAST